MWSRQQLFNVAVSCGDPRQGLFLGDAEGRRCFGDAAATEFIKTMEFGSEEAKE